MVAKQLGRPIASIVIPAHNEAAVIRRCLEALLREDTADLVEIVVACNGCTDDTADIARSVAGPITVLEVAEPSKIGAMRAADDILTTFPRVYLDADVCLSPVALKAVLARLATGEVLAARPQFAYVTDSASYPVRHYYAARSKVPALLSSLWGAGVYVLGEEAHRRVAPWPDVIADDLYADQMFTAEEIEVVTTDPVLVQVPRTSRDLLKVLSRSYRGKDTGTPSKRQATFSKTLMGVLALGLQHPSHLPDALFYALFSVAARLRLLRTSKSELWARDDSSRVPA